ncbi:ketopantoate reductase family protein [Roseovarius sp. E0-M6]|uniref:ketopantoate reductase family protein n=1 Tax=Roseovarius sp. E0-M6 TaxID=3127118 RepID=UPI0030103A5C
MKVAIFGVGAMGSVYAAHFAEAGQDVVAIDPWKAHTDAICADGLRLEGPGADRIVSGITASGDPGLARGADLIIIATKASGVGSAARAVCPFVTPDTTVLTIQNGLGADERITRHLSKENVLLGVADGFGASMQGPGHARHTAMKLIRLGELTGGLTPRLERIASLWQNAGLTARAFSDIHQLIWEKLLCNVTLSAPCTVHDCTVGELMGHPAKWAEALECMQEAYACGNARKIAFSFDDPEAYVTTFANMVRHASPSMRLDHQAGRASEIDFINGAIPNIGEQYGIPTPVNDRLSAEVRAREASFARAVQ